MNTFAEVIIAQTFTHPSGMQYKQGMKIRLTSPIGVAAWLKEGWIIDPNPPAIPVAAPADIPTAGG